jgi:hypothetical protein
LQSQPRYDHPGKPKKGALAEKIVWHLLPTISIDQTEVQAQINKAPLSSSQPLCLMSSSVPMNGLLPPTRSRAGLNGDFASSLFVKKPERVVALSLIMVLSLLLYPLAEHLLPTRLAETEQSVANQINKPTQRPSMDLSML